MHNYKYKFSVILPVYNAEKYLEESIESVIKQNIGFKDNIQLILISDESTDKSEEICLKYKEKYNDNILYLKQENIGAIQAKNKGIEYIEGKYTNILTPHDKWNLNAFSKVWDFFENNYEKIDVVGCRIKYLGETTDYSDLDYKFDNDKVVDINIDYNNIQIDLTSSFIKSSELQANKFDESVDYLEDEFLLGRIILKKCKYGALKLAEYYCRKEENVFSKIGNYKKDIKWYKNSLKYYKDLINECTNKYGKVLPYVQYQIAYDLQFKFSMDVSNFEISKILNEQEKNKFILGIKDVLQNIEDKIIIEQNNIYVSQKVLMLNLKYGKNILEEIEVKKSHIYYKDLHLTNLHNKTLFKIAIMEIKNKKLILEGTVQCILPESDYNIYLKCNKRKLEPIKLIPFPQNDEKSIFGEVISSKRYKISIPLEEVRKIKFILQYKENPGIKLNLSFGNFAKLNELEESYYSANRYIIERKDYNIVISKSSKKKKLKHEWNYLKRLLKIKEYKVIWYRIVYYFIHLLNNKPIWLISDKTHRANDNGMYLFKYITKKEKKARVYFVIDKKSKDYKKMKKYGKVIKYNSIKYRLYFLLASKIISSQANNWVLNAFEDKREFLKDLYKFDFVFLQHGITKDNISKWINKFRKNIKLFVTATKDEYNSIVNDENEYLYTNKEVKLLGFPRFDNLLNNSQKKIIFMPTWRKDIADMMKKKEDSSKREYFSHFKETNFFKFYNRLINDERIIDVLKENGYKGKFFLHPEFEQQAIDFKQNAFMEVEVQTETSDYNKEFSENSLLITDFSSVAFDFAYLKKPVIYTQFDKDTFFAQHRYSEGYFNYERDGFGPVCFDYEDSVNEIIKYIKNGCKMEDKYIHRIDKFYTFKDKNNCKRVYEEILKL